MTENHYPDGSYDVDWTADDEPEYGEYELEELDESGFEPPTDDEREALDAAVREALGLTATTLGVRRVVDMLWTAGFRRQGPITEEMVEAFTVAINRTGYVLDRRATRVGLEAAERAR